MTFVHRFDGLQVQWTRRSKACKDLDEVAKKFILDCQVTNNTNKSISNKNNFQ